MRRSQIRSTIVRYKPARRGTCGTRPRARAASLALLEELNPNQGVHRVVQQGVLHGLVGQLAIPDEAGEPLDLVVDPDEDPNEGRYPKGLGRPDVGQRVLTGPVVLLLLVVKLGQVEEAGVEATGGGVGLVEGSLELVEAVREGVPVVVGHLVADRGVDPGQPIVELVDRFLGSRPAPEDRLVRYVDLRRRIRQDVAVGDRGGCSMRGRKGGADLAIPTPVPRRRYLYCGVAVADVVVALRNGYREDWVGGLWLRVRGDGVPVLLEGRAG